METVDHRSIIANLPEQERTRLLERSDAAGLRHLVLHLGGILICTILILLRIPLWPLVMPVQGILIVFLFTTLHETVHETPFRSRGLNEWVGRICGFLVFLGLRWFRYFHLAHHRYTHQPGKDPELASPKPETVWQYVTYLTGIPETVERLRTLFRNATRENRDEFVPVPGRPKVMQEARIQLGLYVALVGLSVFLESTVLVYVWLLPFLLGGPFLRAYLLAEHARCPHVASMFENTRTTFTNSIVRFLAWNMPYHAEHHAYPAVPFHMLPEFHQHTKAHLAQTVDGYSRFNQNYLTGCQTESLKAAE